METRRPDDGQAGSRYTGRCWLQELSWPEVHDHLTRDDVILLPVGSTEQHGPHLPLGTDSMTAIGLAADAATEAGALVAPPIWYGWSPHHLAYPGSVTLVPEHLAAIVGDVGRSLAYHGFGRLVIVNGHREANLAPLRIAQARLANQTGQLVVIVDPYYFGASAAQQIRESAPGGVGHADELETGHLLHLRPDLVRMDRAVRNMPGVRRFFVGDPYVTADRAFGVNSVEAYRAHTAPSGVSGDPLPATPEKGRHYHEKMVADLVRLINDLRATPVTLKPVGVPV
jgi:creatinine amidohydrolase